MSFFIKDILGDKINETSKPTMDTAVKHQNDSKKYKKINQGKY